MKSQTKLIILIFLIPISYLFSIILVQIPIIAIIGVLLYWFGFPLIGIIQVVFGILEIKKSKENVLLSSLLIILGILAIVVWCLEFFGLTDLGIISGT